MLNYAAYAKPQAEHPDTRQEPLFPLYKAPQAQEYGELFRIVSLTELKGSRTHLFPLTSLFFTTPSAGTSRTVFARLFHALTVSSISATSVRALTLASTVLFITKAPPTMRPRRTWRCRKETMTRRQSRASPPRLRGSSRTSYWNHRCAIIRVLAHKLYHQ